MGKKKNLGAWGEGMACKDLRGSGVEIVEINFRCKPGEIDIIAREADALLFIEVKTRADLRCGLPCESVTPHKQKRIARAAEYYLSCKQAYGTELRFDVIEILSVGGKAWIRHIRGAF
ncbi:MAG: YraN family protein [Clostridiales Family XIII bacterium]|jgi:putative endonuclease|nr:YraN family protein [Clostridiales Family XIII bacterium]